MNTIWSDNIQGVMTLYLSRKLRFDDVFFDQYDKVFRLSKRKHLKILEIGCGPGTLAGALHRWYPNAAITAVDRDSRFIAFARQHEPGICFYEGDATALPFKDNTFDVTVSYTVSEHIEPTAFYAEQKRVLKPGGVCLVLSARKGMRHTAACLETTSEEQAFWGRVQANDDTFEKYAVGKYAITEQALPLAMEQNGFSQVSTGYAVLDLTPDDPKYPAKLAKAMIEAEKEADIEAVRATHDKDAEAIVAVLNDKYDTRLRLYESGQAQWDTNVSITMAVRGVKSP